MGESICVFLQLNACKALRKKKTASVNQRHFFENPNRYDEADQLLHSTVRSPPTTDMTSTHMSIPSLTGSITNITPHQPQALYTSNSGGYYGSGSNTSLSGAHRNQSTRHSINTTGSHHHNKTGTYPTVMPGTTPPKLFTSPSFLDR